MQALNMAVMMAIQDPDNAELQVTVGMQRISLMAVEGSGKAVMYLVDELGYEALSGSRLCCPLEAITEIFNPPIAGFQLYILLTACIMHGVLSSSMLLGENSLLPFFGIVFHW